MELDQFIQICDEIVPDENGCKNWPMGKTKAGYPQLKIGPFHTYGHRLALELKLGRKIHPGLNALHECDNPGCVEQSHLEEGTQKKNMQESIQRGRFIHGDKNGSRTKPEKRPRGSKNGSAVIGEAQVLALVALHRTGNYTQHELALRFGIHQWSVWCILNGRNWGHITGIPKKPRRNENE